MQTLAALVAVVASVACSTVAEPTRAVVSDVPASATTVQDRSIKLGLVLDLDPQDGAVGRSCQEAVILAVETVNGRGGVRLLDGDRRRLDLIQYDDDGSAESTALAIRRLSEQDDAIAIVGPDRPETALVASALADERRLPLISLTADRDAPKSTGGWTFSVALSDLDALTALVEYLSAGGPRAVAWIAPRTATAAAARARFGRLLGTEQLALVAEDSYPLGDPTLGSRVARLAQPGPQDIVGWPHDAADAAQLAQAVAQRDPRPRLYLGPSAASDSFLVLAGDAVIATRLALPRLLVADDLWDHDPLTPAVRDFRRAYYLRFGRWPIPEAATAWDSVQLIVDAVERGGATRESVRSALETTVSFAGASGPIKFSPTRHDGLDERAFLVARSVVGGWRLPP